MIIPQKPWCCSAAAPLLSSHLQGALATRKVALSELSKLARKATAHTHTDTHTHTRNTNTPSESFGSTRSLALSFPVEHKFVLYFRSLHNSPTAAAAAHLPRIFFLFVNYALFTHPAIICCVCLGVCDFPCELFTRPQLMPKDAARLINDWLWHYVCDLLAAVLRSNIMNIY